MHLFSEQQRRETSSFTYIIWRAKLSFGLPLRHRDDGVCSACARIFVSPGFCGSGSIPIVQGYDAAHSYYIAYCMCFVCTTSACTCRAIYGLRRRHRCRRRSSPSSSLPSSSWRSSSLHGPADGVVAGSSSRAAQAICRKKHARGSHYDVMYAGGRCSTWEFPRAGWGENFENGSVVFEPVQKSSRLDQWLGNHARNHLLREISLRMMRWEKRIIGQNCWTREPSNDDRVDRYCGEIAPCLIDFNLMTYNFRLFKLHRTTIEYNHLLKNDLSFWCKHVTSHWAMTEHDYLLKRSLSEFRYKHPTLFPEWNSSR